MPTEDTLDLSRLMVPIGSPEAIDRDTLDLSALMHQIPGMPVGDSTLAPVTDTTQQLPLSLAGAIPEENVYANSDGFRDVLEKALQGGIENLTDAERKQVKMAREQFPDVDAVFAEAEKRQQEEDIAKDPEQALLARIGQNLQNYPTGGPVGRVGEVKTAVDAVATVGETITTALREEAGRTPGPVSPFRDTNENPLTPEEVRAQREWSQLGLADKTLAMGRRLGFGAVAGGLEFMTQTLDPIVNPEKYGTTSHQAILETAEGFVNMIAEAPDQVAYLAELAGAPDVVKRFAEGIGTVLQGPRVIFSDDTREELKQQAVNHLYEHPESLPFALLIVKGAHHKMTGMTKPKLGPESDYMVVKKSEVEAVGEKIVKEKQIEKAGKEPVKLEPEKKPTEVTEAADALEKRQAEKVPVEEQAKGGEEVRKAPEKAEAVKEEVTPESVAKEFDVTYNGPQERLGGKPPVHLFTDKKTGSTIAIEDLGKAGERFAESRKKFESAPPEGMVAPRPSFEEAKGDSPFVTKQRLQQDIRHFTDAIVENEVFIKEKGPTKTAEELADLKQYQKQLESKVVELKADVEKIDVSQKETVFEPIKEAIDKMETDAKKRLSDRMSDTGTQLFDITGAAGEGVSLVRDLAVVAAAKVARKAVNFSEWSADMVKEHGPKIKPHLQKIWDESQKILKTWRDESEITAATNEMAQKAKDLPEIEIGVAKAKEAMIEHDRQTRRAEFTNRLFEKTVKDVVPDAERQMLMTHAYEHKMKGEYWDKLTEAEKDVVRWAAKEKEKLNQFIEDNKVLDMMEDPNVNHIFHHWIDPKTGKPYKPMYGKTTKGLPQAKQRTIPDYATGMKATPEQPMGAGEGMTPATMNLGKLIGLEWESVMRAHQSREMFKTLHNLGADKDLTIVRRGGSEPSPIRMIERWDQLEKQGLTDGYERYSHPSLDKPLVFKDVNGTTTLLKGAVGARAELMPFLKAYLENPNYTTIDGFNFATKSLKLGMSLFHVQSLAMQEMANWRIPYKNIPRGHRLIKELGPDIQLLHQEGLDLFKGYEDIGYRNTFFEGTGVASKVGNKLTWPITKMRDFIFGVVQPGMKVSFAYDTFQKILPKYQEKYADTMTPKEIERFAARDAVNAADGHFSHEHWKRSLLETNRFMARMYFGPESRKWWQRGLLSPTWQREHLLVAKNVSKSFMPDSWIKKVGLTELGPIKAEYRKYALGAIVMVGTVDLWNLMSTQMMDGEAKHIWENPEGKGFAVRAPWDEPGYTVTREDGSTRDIRGGAAYIRPLKSIYEVAEWVKDPVKKFSYKLSPMITAIARQLWPSRYQQEYGGIEDIPKRTIDFALDVGTPITAGQATQAIRGRKTIPGAALPFFGFPTSKVPYPSKAEVQLQIEELIGEGKHGDAVKLYIDWTKKYPTDPIGTLLTPKARKAIKDAEGQVREQYK